MKGHTLVASKPIYLWLHLCACSSIFSVETHKRFHSAGFYSGIIPVTYSDTIFPSISGTAIQCFLVLLETLCHLMQMSILRWIYDRSDNLVDFPGATWVVPANPYHLTNSHYPKPRECRMADTPSVNCLLGTIDPLKWPNHHLTYYIYTPANIMICASYTQYRDM